MLKQQRQQLLGWMQLLLLLLQWSKKQLEALLPFNYRYGGRIALLGNQLQLLLVLLLQWSKKQLQRLLPFNCRNSGGVALLGNQLQLLLLLLQWSKKQLQRLLSFNCRNGGGVVALEKTTYLIYTYDINQSVPKATIGDAFGNRGLFGRHEGDLTRFS